jgi:hypothetical protein
LAEIYYDKTKTTKSSDAIASTARTAIINFKNAELDNFNSKFKLSRLLRSIDDSDTSISYSDVVTLIEKRLSPQIGTSRNYKLEFGTSISREDTENKIYSTPAFTKYDGEGVIRSCFFEETPGSSSGIESIEIVSAPTEYNSIPTIVISGDGVGANAYPVVVNGKITEIIVDKPGINYTTATALLYYQDEFDNTASFTVNIQGRYGILRSYFFDDNNIKTVLNAEAGTIDYTLGTISLREFDPVSVSDPIKILRIIAKPKTNNFESARSRIITIDEEDSNAIKISVKTVE